MAFNEALGTAVVEIRASTDKLKKGLRSAEDQTKRSTSSMKAAFASLNVGVVALAASLTAIGSSIITASANLEQMRVGFESALGSASSANKLLDELRSFATKTPFQLADIGRASRQLLAAGVAAEDITDRLKFLGDAAAGAQVPLNDMAAIFAKIQNKGKAMTEELLQLSDRGIPIIRVLAKEMGVAESAVFELASQGAITADVMEMAFRRMSSEGGIFANQMEKQSETLIGKWSTFKDTLIDLAAAIGEHLLPILSKMLSALTMIVSTVNKGITAFKGFFSSSARANEELTKSVEMATGRAAGGKRPWEIPEEFIKDQDKATEKQTSFNKELKKTSKIQKEIADNSLMAGPLSSVGGGPIAAPKNTTVGGAFSKMFDQFQNEAPREIKGILQPVFSRFNDKLSDTFQSAEFGFDGIFKDVLNSLGSSLSNILGGLGGRLGGSIGSSVGGFLGSAVSNIFGGFFADGGRPPMGKVSVVGEQGPELFVPNSSGTVIPNDSLGGMGGMNVNVQPVFVGVDAQIQSKINAATPQIVQASKAAVADAISRGDRRFRSQ